VTEKLSSCAKVSVGQTLRTGGTEVEEVVRGGGLHGGMRTGMRTRMRLRMRTRMALTLQNATDAHGVQDRWGRSGSGRRRERERELKERGPVRACILGEGQSFPSSLISFRLGERGLYRAPFSAGWSWKGG